MTRSEIIKNINVSEIRKAMDGLEAMAIKDGAEGLDTPLDMRKGKIKKKNATLTSVCIGCWLYRYYLNNTKDGFFLKGVEEFSKRIFKKPIYKNTDTVDIPIKVEKAISKTRLWPMPVCHCNAFSHHIPYTYNEFATIGEAIEVWRKFADRLDEHRRGAGKC